MINNKENTISQQNKIFFEANNNNWHIKQLYNQLEAIKIQKQQQPLTELEKVCLQGLICGYPPDKIAQKLVEELDPFLIQVTFWTLYHYIQIMVSREEVNIPNYQILDIISSLEASGYNAENADSMLKNGDDQNGYTAASTEAKAKSKLEESFPENSNNAAITPQIQSDTLTHQSQNNTLTQVDENDFMPAINPWTKLGGLFLVGSVGMAIALSAFTPYKVTVQAQAKVRPAGELRIVEAKTEGTVVAINIKENQKIQRGDIIATIDSSRLETEKSQLQSQIQQSKLQLGQINAQITTLERQIQAEKDRIQRAIEVATVELSRRRREHQDRLVTTSAEVQEAKANIRSIKAALNAARAKQQRYQSIAAEGVISENLLEEAKLDTQQQKEALEAARAELQSAQAALNPNDGEIAIARKRIAQERNSGDAAAAALNREREALIQQRIELEEQLARDHRELKQIDRDIEQTIIKAPENGILFQLSLRNPSQTVKTGSEIARIAPDQTSLAVEALVSSSDIGNLKIGQKAHIRISACPYPDYGTLKGVVKKISPDAIPYDSNSNSSSQNMSPTKAASAYKVKLEPAHLTLSQGKNQCALQLGMEGRADIITKEETIFKFILRKARLLTDL